MDDEQLWEIAKDILQEIYIFAKPSLDFKEEIKENGKFRKDNPETEPDAYLDHYLPQEKQEKIIQKHLEKHFLNKAEKKKIKTEVTLGLAPAGSKKAWKKTEEGEK